MDTKLIKYINAVSGFVFFLVVALCIYVFCFSDNEETQISSSGKVINITQFVTEDGANINLPCSLRVKKGDKIILNCTLPEEIKENSSLSCRSLYCKNELYIDNVLVNSYGKILPLSFGRMTGNIRIITPLSPDMAGKELKLVITPYYTFKMDLSSLQIGYTDEIKREIFHDNFFRIIVSVILATIMFIAIGIRIYQLIADFSEHAKLVKNFIIFDFLVIAWIICSSDIPQFITNCNEGVSLVSFLSLSIIGIPLMGMCEYIIPNKAKFFMILGKVGWLLPLTICICFIFNICDPMEILILTHIYMAVCIISTLVISIMEFRKAANSKFLLVGIIEISVSALAGLVCWFIAPSKGYDATAFGIGFILFISTLFSLIGYMQFKLVEDKKYSDVYKKMAYVDSLTSLKNRTAFEQKFASMQEESYKDIYVTLIMFDLNHLKKTNDSFGHPAGDKLITATADIIRKVFGEFGDCYRLGGDEFAVVLLDYKDDIDETIDKFRGELTLRGYQNNLNLSCAVGYAGMKWNPGDTFFRDLYKIADKAMYNDKIRTRHGKEGN